MKNISPNNLKDSHYYLVFNTMQKKFSIRKKLPHKKCDPESIQWELISGNVNSETIPGTLTYTSYDKVRYLEITEFESEEELTMFVLSNSLTEQY